MTKPKAVAQAVTAKNRMPSLLRTANIRINSNNKQQRSASASPGHGHQTILALPPLDFIDADLKGLGQISDLTEPLYELKREPPVQEVHSAYQSAASSLTMPSVLEKARRSFGSDDHHPNDILDPKCSNLIYPESPMRRTGRQSKKSSSLDVALNDLALHALEQNKQITIQKSDSSDTLSQLYVVKKRHLVVGIPVVENVNNDANRRQQPSPAGTDLAIADRTNQTVPSPSATEEAVVTSKADGDVNKPAPRKLGFKAVKALINRVQSAGSGGSPRKQPRSSPTKASKQKKGGGMDPKNTITATTELSQRDQALLLVASTNQNLEETVSGIPVNFQNSNSTRRHLRPVQQIAASTSTSQQHHDHLVVKKSVSTSTASLEHHHHHHLRLEPPDMTRTRSSNDPSPKKHDSLARDNAPPDLTMTMSSADMSAESHVPGETTSYHATYTTINENLVLEPPELEPPRPGSPELRSRSGGASPPAPARESRRRGLEPDALVPFGERKPVDAPENLAVIPPGPLSIIGIPVDSDEVLALMGARPETDPVDEEQPPDAAESGVGGGDGPSNTKSKDQRHGSNPFDSSSDGSIPISARVARARRATRPINPFDSGSSENSSASKKNGPKNYSTIPKTNPFDDSSDSSEVDDDDPFDRILSENQFDSLTDDGIPPPGRQMDTTAIPNDGPSPLREHNRGSQPPPPPRNGGPKALAPPKNLHLCEGSLVSDLDQSQYGFPTTKVHLENDGADVASFMNTDKDAQEASAPKEASTKVFPLSGEVVALADSISEWSGNHSHDSDANNDVEAKPQQVMGQIVPGEDDELDLLDNERRQSEEKSVPEQTPRVSNEAAKKAELPKRNKLVVERAQKLGQLRPAGGESPLNVVHPPVRARRHNIAATSVQVAYSPVSFTNAGYDRYHFTDASDDREDVLDRLFTFIRQTVRLTPKRKRSVDRSISKLEPEAKLIVLAALEKAKHADTTKDGLEQFYQDEDIEMAFQNITGGSVQSIQHLMAEHKRAPFLKIKQLGESIASTSVHDVDVDEASELLSELQDFSSVVKGAARRSLKKSQSAGIQAPKWTKELIDLTGVDSFRELDDKEAVWLFDLNSTALTPRSDMESLMDFAAKRLGLALDPELVLTAASKGKPPISTAGPLSPQSAVSDSPFAAIRASSNSHGPKFKFDTQIIDGKDAPKEEDLCNDACRYAENVLCGESGYDRQAIETSESNESNKGADKYDVSQQADKYSKALDDKLFEDKLSEDQFHASIHLVPASAKQTDRESDVSSTDGLSVILAKIQRDIKTTEEKLHQTEEVKGSSSSDEESQPSPPSTKPQNRRDFLDVLFAATGSMFCGAVDVGTKSTYETARKRSKRKKEKKRPDKDLRNEPDDPFIGLELESPNADSSPMVQNNKLNGSTVAKCLPSINTRPTIEKATYENACERLDRREHFEDNRVTNEEEANVDEQIKTIPRLEVDAFEKTGSLLNRGPFSPIDEQPSAEEDCAYPSFDHDQPLSPCREVEENDDGGPDVTQEGDENDATSLNDAAPYHSDLFVADDCAAVDRSGENVNNEGDKLVAGDAAFSLNDDASDQLDRNEASGPEVGNVNGSDGHDGGDVSEADLVRATDPIVDYDRRVPCQSNGPKPEDLPLSRRCTPPKSAVAREPPIPEVYDGSSLGERSCIIHDGAESADHDANSFLGLSLGSSIEQSQLNLSEVGDALPDHAAILPSKVTTSKDEDSGRYSFETADSNETPVDDDRALDRPSTPESIDYLHSAHSSAASTTKTSEDVPSRNQGKRTPPTPERRSSTISDAPPTPELVRPSTSDFSKTRVSMIRSKFENSPAAASPGSTDKTAVKPQLAGSPESLPSRRMSRMALLRSKFEKRVSGKREDGGATESNLHAVEVPSHEMKLERQEATVESTQSPDLIDLTTDGSRSFGQENLVTVDEDARVEAVLSEEPLEAVLSGEGMRPESPIIVDENTYNDEYSREHRMAFQLAHMRPECPIIVDEISFDDDYSGGHRTALQPGAESPIIVDEGSYDDDYSRSDHMAFLMSEHIDLVSLKESRNHNVEAAWIQEDGRSSDIAFSLSPSTAASSRVLQTYTQHHLFDALPVLAASTSSDGTSPMHDMLVQQRDIDGTTIEVPKPKGSSDRFSGGSQSSGDVSISSTNVEGVMHCDLDPNTIPKEITMNKKSTPRSLLQNQRQSIDLPWSDGDGDESSGDEPASLLLALTRSESEGDFIDTVGTTPSSGKEDKAIETFQESAVATNPVESHVPNNFIDTVGTTPSSGKQDKAIETFQESAVTTNPVESHVPNNDESSDGSVRLRIRTSTPQETKEEARPNSINESYSRPHHVFADDASKEGSASPRIRAYPKTVEPDSPPRKVSSPLYLSIQKRLSKSKGEPGPSTVNIPPPIDAEELFAILDRANRSVIDVTSYKSLPENEQADREASGSEASEGTVSSETSEGPVEVKTNYFLETIMDRLRVSSSAQRFTPKKNDKVSPRSLTSGSRSVEPMGRSFESVGGDRLDKKGSSSSSDVDELFQRYDDIVKNMVVLDEERLARVQARQMASIVMAADSAVEHVPNSPRALSEIARRLRRTAAERKKEDKAIVYTTRDESFETADATVEHRSGGTSAASESTHPSSHIRQLRRDLQAALDKSAAIRQSQVELGAEMASFQNRLQERRGSLSPGRTRPEVVRGSPTKIYRNCAACSVTDSTSFAEADDHSSQNMAGMRDQHEIPITISTQTTDMTLEDEDIQNRQLESIRSGLRSTTSVGRTSSSSRTSPRAMSPRTKARRWRFRRSD